MAADSPRIIAVTGVGLVTPSGIGVREVWTSWVAGRCTIRPSALYSGACLGLVDRDRLESAEAAGRIPVSDGLDHSLPMICRFALLAAREAMAMGRSYGTAAPTAIVIGVSGGNGPTFVPHGLNQFHGITDVVARFAHVEGPTTTVNNACASSAVAVSLAMDLLESDPEARVLAGGAEEILGTAVWGFDAVGAMDSSACSPFGRSTGMSLGEGAAFLLLESMESALNRAVEPLALLVGAHQTCDAFAIVAPDPSGAGAVAAMVGALERAGLTPFDVGYVNTHGTGTKTNDEMESLALQTVFAGHPGRVLITATKSLIGHTQGAAGAVEAVATVLSLRQGIALPTANSVPARTVEPLDLVTEAKPLEPALGAISTNFAFGGLNSALVFRRYDKRDYGERDRSVSPRGPRRKCSQVAIVGAALVGLPGNTGRDWYAAMRRAECYVERVEPHWGMPPPDLSSPSFTSPKDWRRLDGTTRLMLHAVRAAMEDAQVSPELLSGPRTGLIVATRSGALDAVLELNSRTDIGRKPNPILFPQITLTSHIGHLSRLLSITGPGVCVTSGAASAAIALATAQRWLDDHSVDSVLVVAADWLNELSFRGEVRAHLGSECRRPFDPTSVGVALGSAGGALLLERASVPGELRIMGVAHGAGDQDAPHRATIMRSAVANAGLQSPSVALMLAAANGDVSDDAAELLAIKQCVAAGALRSVDAISSPARLFGHCQAAAGLVGVVLGAVAIRTGVSGSVLDASGDIWPVWQKSSGPAEPIVVVNCASWGVEYGSIVMSKAPDEGEIESP